MRRVRWTGWRWGMLLLTVGLLAISLGLFNFYRSVVQIKQTGQPILVRVMAKERGSARSANKVFASYGGQEILISTRSKPFFKNSEVGQMVTVLKRPDSDLYVPATEPTTGFFVLIVAVWGVVVMLLYLVFTQEMK